VRAISGEQIAGSGGALVRSGGTVAERAAPLHAAATQGLAVVLPAIKLERDVSRRTRA
jgi:hypothetical protein